VAEGYGMSLAKLNAENNMCFKNNYLKHSEIKVLNIKNKERI